MRALAEKKAMTVDEFLGWVESQPERPRLELINGRPVAMAPERARHNIVKGRAFSTLDTAVRNSGLSCSVFTDGMTVVIDDQTAYEPDALVYCGEALAGDAVVVPEPVIIVEVLSPSTGNVDSGAKFHGYFSLASVRHYLVVDPEAKTIMHHRRSDAGEIITAIVRDGTFELSPPGLAVRHGEIFENV